MDIKISVFLPFIIGILGGILVSMLGIGGGFVMIPAMIYMLKIPTRIAVGTSLLQIFIVSIIVTLINAGVNKTVDIILASFLLITSVIGAQIGIRISKNISPIRIKLLLALIIIFIASELAISLLIEPDNLYEVFKN